MAFRIREEDARQFWYLIVDMQAYVVGTCLLCMFLYWGSASWFEWWLHLCAAAVFSYQHKKLSVRSEQATLEWFNMLLVLLFCEDVLLSVVGVLFFDLRWTSMHTFTILSGALFWGVHVLGHGPRPRFPFLLEWWRAHFIGHHRQQYPPDDCVSIEYRDNKNDPYGLSWLAYLVLGLALTLLVGCVFENYTIVQIASLLGAQWLRLTQEDWAHRNFHLAPKSWLYNNVNSMLWGIPAGLDRVHILFHHCANTTVNFGVVNLYFDLMFGTLQLEESKKL